MIKVVYDHKQLKVSGFDFQVKSGSLIQLRLGVIVLTMPAHLQQGMSWLGIGYGRTGTSR